MIRRQSILVNPRRDVARKVTVIAIMTASHAEGGWTAWATYETTPRHPQKRSRRLAVRGGWARDLRLASPPWQAPARAGCRVAGRHPYLFLGYTCSPTCLT